MRMDALRMGLYMQITQYIADKDTIAVAISLVAANSIEEVSEVSIAAHSLHKLHKDASSSNCPTCDGCPVCDGVIFILIYAVSCRPYWTCSHAAPALRLMQDNLSCRHLWEPV